MSVGKKIKQLRGKLTLAEFGALFDVGPANISAIETEKSNPSYELAIKICNYYGCTMDWLFRDVGTYGESPKVNEPEIEYVPLTKHMEVLEKYNKLLEERLEKQEQRSREQSLKN